MKIGKDSKRKPGYGVVQISLRSQIQLPERIIFWFVRDGEDPGRARNRITFTRQTDLFGSRPTRSHVGLYAMRPGRYRLIAHISPCLQFPPPDTICTYGNRFAPEHYPTARYDGLPSPVIIVEADKFTDAGEFILEFPYNAGLTPHATYKELNDLRTSMQVRWRPIAPENSLQGRYPDLPLVENEPVHDLFKSNVTCKEPPKGVDWLPFQC